MVTDKGKVKVADFGIARACTSETITFAGSMVGSVHYFSPEQARGGKADIQSDLYSASVVLYEMATGQLPFSAESPVSVALMQITEEPTPPSQLNSEISPELERIILKGMSKSSLDRYASAVEMKEALLQLVNGEGLAMATAAAPAGNTATDSPKKERKNKKLRPLGWAALVIGLFLLMGAGYFAALGFFKVDEVEVPNVVNEEVETAKEILEKAGLKVNVLNELHDIEVPEGHVISQNPEGGSRVKKNRVVTLEVSKGPEIVQLPDVTGQTLQEAETVLANLGFKVAPDISYIFDSKVREGRIIQQFPKALTEQEQGTEVSLVISKGPQPQYIKMPDLRGLSLEEAKKKLDEVRLELGSVNSAESNFYHSGQVADQSVQPAANILQGQTVNIVVSKGPGPEAKFVNVTVTVPDDGEKHRIRIEVVDAKGSHEEYNNLHDPGDRIREKIAYYGQGTIKVYRDGQLIHEQPVN